MVKKYLTIAEIAEQADLPNSTCRRYLTTFDDFFLVKGGSRLKKYEEQAVDILKRIKGLYEEGLESNEIHNVLINEFPLVVNGDEQREISEQPSTVPTLATSEDIQQIKEMLEKQQQFNHALLEEMKRQQALIEAKDHYIETSIDERDKKLVESLRSSLENKELQKQLDEIKSTLAEVAANKDKERKGFFSRLFGK